jgi:hypothetical protein
MAESVVLKRHVEKTSCRKKEDNKMTDMKHLTETSADVLVDLLVQRWAFDTCSDTLEMGSTA